jgi:predicted transcriptional regulator
MAKTEVYSWRLSSEIKGDLEEVARRKKLSVSRLLEHIVREWLEEYRNKSNDEADEQERLHRAAMRTFGKIRGGDPHRSERARQALRAKLARRRAG